MMAVNIQQKILANLFKEIICAPPFDYKCSHFNFFFLSLPILLLFSFFLQFFGYILILWVLDQLYMSYAFMFLSFYYFYYYYPVCELF
jgi:hypothetical protein